MSERDRIEALEITVADMQLANQHPLVRRARPGGGSGARYAVVRSLLIPGEPFVEVSFGEYLDVSPWFQLLTDDRVKIRTEGPPAFSEHYEYFLWIGPESPSEPIAHVDGMIPLPVINIGGVDVILHYTRIMHLEPPTKNVPTTDGGGIDAGGNLSFLPGALP